MIKKYFILFLLIAGTIYAQGGSVYTRLGLGDLNYNYSARRAGMVQGGIAVPDVNHLSVINPAGIYNLNFTRLDASMNFRGISTGDENTNSFFMNPSFNGFVFGFPVSSDHGIAFAGGIIPHSVVKYNIIRNVDNSSYSSTESYEGKGGISKAFFNGTYKLPLNLVLGASVEYYFGKIDYLSSIEFTNSNLIGSTFTESNKFYGYSFSFGLLSPDISQYLNIKNVDDLYLGFIFGVPNKINREKSLINSSTVFRQEIETQKGKVNMPLNYGFGLSLELDNNYLFFIDYLATNLNDLKIIQENFEQIDNTGKFNFGFEYRRERGRFSSFWEQILLRGGFSYEKTPYRINGKSIEQFSISTGISFPVSYGSTLDLGIQYGKRGTTENGLLSENLFNLNIGFSFGELWFQRVER